MHLKCISGALLHWLLTPTPWLCYVLKESKLQLWYWGNLILVCDLCIEYLCIILLVQDVFRKEHNLRYLWICKFKLGACEIFQLTWYLQKDRKIYIYCLLAQAVSALAFWTVLQSNSGTWELDFFQIKLIRNPWFRCRSNAH